MSRGLVVSMPMIIIIRVSLTPCLGPGTKTKTIVVPCLGNHRSRKYSSSDDSIEGSIVRQAVSKVEVNVPSFTIYPARP